MKTKHYILALTIGGVSLSLQAQDNSSWQYLRAHRLWQSELIPASLGRDTLQTLGISSISTGYRAGTYHHIQEGKSVHDYQFNTEQYRKVGKYLYGYGRVGLHQARTEGRAWADQYRPVRSNPYISGSPVVGSYTQQGFDLSAGLSTHAMGRWTLGLGLDYNMGDLSRLKDPRSRVSLLDYKITPSATYRLSSKHTIGLGLSYQRRKEKLLSLTTVQDDPNLAYADMKGLDAVTITVGGYKGFGRQWVDHRHGISLAHGYKGSRLSSMLTLGYVSGRENIMEDIKYQPGLYRSESYSLDWRLVARSSRLSHTVALGVGTKFSRADEYYSERVSTIDPVTRITSQSWSTLIIYKDRYRQDEGKLSINYLLGFDDHNGGRRLGYVGVENSMHVYQERYMLPERERVFNRLTHTLVCGSTFGIGAKGQLTLDAKIGYSHLPMDDNTFFRREDTNLYGWEVIRPLQEYEASPYTRYTLSAEYQHRLKLGGIERNAFLRLSGDLIRTQQHQSRYNLGLTLGLYH